MFENLCKQAGKSTTRVGQELGIPKTTVSYWRNKKGFVPKQDVLKSICDYFDVPISYFFDGNIKKETAVIDRFSHDYYLLDDEDKKPLMPLFRHYYQILNTKKKMSDNTL